MVAPGLGTTTAVIASRPALVRQPDHDDLGDRGSAAYTAFSTSIEATFSPPVLMTSLSGR